MGHCLAMFTLGVGVLLLDMCKAEEGEYKYIKKYGGVIIDHRGRTVMKHHM